MERRSDRNHQAFRRRMQEARKFVEPNSVPPRPPVQPAVQSPEAAIEVTEVSPRVTERKVGTVATGDLVQVLQTRQRLSRQ